MAKKKVEKKSETSDMVKLYEAYFENVQKVHGVELIGILDFKCTREEKHALAADFLKRTFNEFLKMKGMETIEPDVLGVALVLMDTISVQIEKTHKDPTNIGEAVYHK